MDKEEAFIDLDFKRSLGWKGMVWHHSATGDGVARDWDSIRRFHTSYRVDHKIVTQQEFETRLKLGQGTTFQKPWADIGYHGGVERVNGALAFVPGRPLNKVGAHSGVKGASNLFNELYVGLCCVGNFDDAPPDMEMREFCLSVTRTFLRAFNIPKAHVIGHRTVFMSLGVKPYKSCPGKHWDIEQFQSDL